MPKIVIGCPAKNRAWILPEYLAALEAIDYHNKEYIFMENNSNDATLTLLRRFRSRSPTRIFSLTSKKHQGEARTEYWKENYAYLAKIRNRFLELFLQTDGEYLLSIDSDIIVPADIIKQLLPLADGKTMVGAAISNIPNCRLDGQVPGNFMFFDQETGSMHHPKRYTPRGILDVDVVGACYLIPRKVIKDGVRYGPDRQGEDIPFCKKAKELGYKLKVKFGIDCEHRMVKP